MSEQKSTGEWMEDAVCRECLEYQLRYEARGTAQTAGIFGCLTADQRGPLRKKLREAMKDARKETLS